MEIPRFSKELAFQQTELLKKVEYYTKLGIFKIREGPYGEYTNINPPIHLICAIYNTHLCDGPMGDLVDKCITNHVFEISVLEHRE